MPINVLREIMFRDCCSRKNILETLIVPQHTAQSTTNDLACLDLTIRKHDVRLGLTHVTDDAFNFFWRLDDELNCQITRSNLKKYKDNLFAYSTQQVMSSSGIKIAWKSLFWPKFFPPTFMEDFLKSTPNSIHSCKMQPVSKGLPEQRESVKVIGNPEGPLSKAKNNNRIPQANTVICQARRTCSNVFDITEDHVLDRESICFDWNKNDQWSIGASQWNKSSCKMDQTRNVEENTWSCTGLFMKWWIKFHSWCQSIRE